MAMVMPPRQARQGKRATPKSETKQFRGFKGVNLTDSRTAIEDDELYWLENAVTVGKGAIQIIPAQGATVATLAQGITSLWGVTLNGTPIMIAVGSDGSLSQINTGGVVTVIAPAGTVTGTTAVTIWRGSPVLIVDSVKGYFSWDGVTFTTIDATKTANAIAVFEGRVWLANGRTITYTAPAAGASLGYNDFTAGNGAGATLITDEAFSGNVVTLYSALEQLWIIGNAAVDAIANVQSSGVAPNVVTTFSITNILTNVGTNSPGSVTAYFRALTLLAPFGAYALSGVTPQKLSDKLDGLFPDLTFSPDVPAAVAIVQNLLCLMFLVTYTGTLAAGSTSPVKLLLCFTQGKWFFARQGDTLKWATSLIVGGIAQAWGADSSGNIYQLFGGGSSTVVTYKVLSKLYDFGLATQMKVLTKVGLELQATAAVAPTMTVDSEFGNQTITVTTSNVYTLLNAAQNVLTLVNPQGTLILVGQGLVLSRQNGAFNGRYLGWSITGTDVPYRIQAVQFEIIKSRDWWA